MTEQELEVIRVNLRIEVLKILVGGLYTALAKQSPSAAQALLTKFAEIRQDHSKIALKGLVPEYSNLIAAEYQEALDEMLGSIEQMFENFVFDVHGFPELGEKLAVLGNDAIHFSEKLQTVFL